MKSEVFSTKQRPICLCIHFDTQKKNLVSGLNSTFSFITVFYLNTTVVAFLTNMMVLLLLLLQIGQRRPKTEPKGNNYFRSSLMYNVEFCICGYPRIICEEGGGIYRS